MPFLNNIPQPAQLLSDSQPQLLNNNIQLDLSFGVDHYPFSDLTANNGFHNQVTTPAYVASPTTGLPPVTTAATPILYAFQDSANLGTIQYSRGWQIADGAPAAPSPVTCFQSPTTGVTLTANTPITAFDFTGLPHAIASAYVVGLSGSNTICEASVNWTGSALAIYLPVRPGSLIFQVSGSILQVISTAGATNVYWTVRFHRIG